MQHLLIQMLFQVLSFYVWTQYHTYLMYIILKQAWTLGPVQNIKVIFIVLNYIYRTDINLLATLLFWNLDHNCFYIILAFHVQTIQIQVSW
jgi:hypothetical protein